MQVIIRKRIITTVLQEIFKTVQQVLQVCIRGKKQILQKTSSTVPFVKCLTYSLYIFTYYKKYLKAIFILTLLDSTSTFINNKNEFRTILEVFVVPGTRASP